MTSVTLFIYYFCMSFILLELREIKSYVEYIASVDPYFARPTYHF